MSRVDWFTGFCRYSSFSLPALLLSLIGLISWPLGTEAQTNWVGQTGSWNVPSNWDNGVPDTSNSATIDNGGTALVQSGTNLSSDLFVGLLDSGNLVVQNQATLSAGPLVIGLFASDSNVTVTGPGSTLTINGNAQVGAFGTGILTVQNGATVQIADYLQLGLFSDSDGTVAVNGTGSSLISAGNIVVGGSGTGRLTIANGGAVTSTNNVEIGFEAGGTGTVVVTGSGSILTSTQVLYVGYSGTGTLTSADRAVIQVGNGTGLLTLGSQSGSIGTLNIGNGNAAGTLKAGEVTGGAGIATVNFNETDLNYIFPVLLTGSLTVAQNGPGKTVLTGANTYTGGTLINGGTLQVNADSNLGSASGGLTFNGGTLQFGTSFDLAATRGIKLGSAGGTVDTNGFSTTISQAITGSGGLTKTGPGTLTLAGTNTYNGDTIINAGSLVVNNRQALGLGNAIVNAGVLRADPQPINVAGNYTQTGGTLQLQIAGASAGQYDFLSVGGHANLGGTLELVSLGYQPKVGDRLTLINTQGLITGRFANWVNPFPTRPGLNTIDLVYSRSSVVLQFLNSVPSTPIITTIDFHSFAQTPNQVAAASLLDAVQLDPRAANLMAFLYQEPFANLPSDFDKISPESLTAFYEIGFSGANLQRLTLEDRLENLRNRSSAVVDNDSFEKIPGDGKSIKQPAVLPPPLEKRWDFWSTGFGDFVHLDSDFNARGYQFTTGGIDLGIDYRLTPHLTLGLMGNYAHTWTDLRPGSINVDSARGGLYSTYFANGSPAVRENLSTFYLNGGIYGGYNSYDSSRRELQGNANGNSNGEEFSAFLGGGYDCRLRSLTIGPIASLQYTSVHLNGFNETGSLAPLSIHSDTEQSLRSDIGFRVSLQCRAGSVLLQPFLKAAWEHEFKYSALPITAGLAEIPGPFATFVGPTEGHDSAIVSAGVSAEWRHGISTYVSYNGQLGRDRYDSNAVIGGVRFSF
jgi:outer membrane autotransporter protein